MRSLPSLPPAHNSIYMVSLLILVVIPTCRVNSRSPCRRFAIPWAVVPDTPSPAVRSAVVVRWY